MDIQTDEEIRAIIDQYLEPPEDEPELDDEDVYYYERLKGDW